MRRLNQLSDSICSCKVNHHSWKIEILISNGLYILSEHYFEAFYSVFSCQLCIHLNWEKEQIPINIQPEIVGFWVRALEWNRALERNCGLVFSYECVLCRQPDLCLNNSTTYRLCNLMKIITSVFHVFISPFAGWGDY